MDKIKKLWKKWTDAFFRHLEEQDRREFIREFERQYGPCNWVKQKEDFVLFPDGTPMTNPQGSKQKEED